MASSSTMKANCYNFINNNLRNLIDNKFDRTASFDAPPPQGTEYGSGAGEEKGSRSTRASSLALPTNSIMDLFDKDQTTFLNPVNLKPTITSSIKNTISSTVNSINKLRRHSSHQLPETERGEEGEGSENPPSTPASAVFSSGFAFFATNITGSKGPSVASSSSTSSTSPAPSVLSNDNLLLHQQMSKKSSNQSSSMNLENKSNLNNGGSSRTSNSVISSKYSNPQTAPPPIPKRTFQGRIKSCSSTNMKKSNTMDRDEPDGTGFYIPSRKSYLHQQTPSMNRNYSKQSSSSTSKARSPGKFSSLSSILMLGRDDDLPDGIIDEDRLSIESSVFEDAPDHTYEINDYFSSNYVFDENNSTILTKKMLSSSNRSSSDSNKSQTTIDTGYMSSNTSTASAVTTNTENDRPINISFRSRFSSEDTQSSLDSFMSSSDLPLRLNGTNHPDSLCYSHTSIIDSNNSGVDVIEYLQKNSAARNCPNNGLRTTATTQSANSANNSQSMGGQVEGKFDNNSGDVECNHSQLLPKVPDRGRQQKNSILPNITPPPSNGKTKDKSPASRARPPAPPMRAQASFDSTKLGSGSQIFGGRQQGVVDSSTTTTTASVHGPRRGLNGILNKPPPLTQIHHNKVNQRQDSSLSSDSFSVTSSPGYNSKSMEAPLLQHASKINRSVFRHQDSSDSFGLAIRNGISANSGKINSRQDSNISSDSFSITSSPGYNSKLMEAPLLAHAVKLHTIKQGFKCADEMIPRSSLSTENNPTSPIIKSASTPASLQTIVRFQNGSNMSLQHKVVNRRKSSNPYITNGRIKFRLCQILLNAVALLAIAGGLAAYFNAYRPVEHVNTTYISKPAVEEVVVPIPTNPAPGICLPVIVKFCQQHHVPYNFTVYPNYIGHFGQIEAQTELENYDALVDVRCYELVGLFLCSLFVPRCGSTGNSVPPCRSLCFETMKRCGFFFDVFGLELPDYLKCSLFTESTNPDECVGHQEVIDAKKRELNPVCSGFLCDQKRCIPSDWRCDGHVDCLDQADEFECNRCGNGSIYCGGSRCMSQKHVCDGVQDCPYGQDERNCIRLSERNGDTGRGILEVYKADIKEWAPACVNNWDGTTSPSAVCSMLGYNSVNGSWIKLPNPGTSNYTMIVPTKDTTSIWQMIQKKKTNLMKEFISCPNVGYHPVAELSCSNFECGKIKKRRLAPRTRIVGGRESKPGDWPFIAAILGGPEEIFYCAGVLISDQWVLTASHCIGNHTMRNLNDWTIQLGITRRHSHTYYGQKVKVARVIPHPKYNFLFAHDNDIALFQLETRVAFHEQLLPVCLPDKKEIKPGTHCTVIGWGKREDKNANPEAAHLSYEPAINEVTVPILERDTCNEWLESLNVTEGMICAGYKEGGKDACQGDSGGPLLCRDPVDKDRWYVGGIVSWGIMCAHPKLPGVYANVPKYIPWIMQEIRKYSTPAQ